MYIKLCGANTDIEMALYLHMFTEALYMDIYIIVE